MNDLEILDEAWGAPAPPSERAYADARAALVKRTARRRGARRPMAAAAAALAVAAGVFVATNLDGPDGVSGVPVASAEVFERAAAAAERRPFTPPRGDQWIYVEERIQSSREGGSETRRTWRRVDGWGMAWLDEAGKLRVRDIEPPLKRSGRPVPFDSYESLAGLPADPDALLRWAYREARNITGAGITEHGDVYAIFNGILRNNVLPPEREAAILRALKQVPGVTVSTLEISGRPAIALGQTEDWLREELLLDRDTYAYLGERSTIVKNTRINPLKAGNSTGQVHKGDVVVSERLATAVVDRPGERP
jgi:hypothetical protein